MLSVLTINHNNSDISFLESFTFNKDSLPMALKQLKMINGVDECFILSTCNRVEVYVSSKNKNIDSEIIKFISDFGLRDTPTFLLNFFINLIVSSVLGVASG